MSCHENSIGFAIKTTSHLLKRKFDEEMAKNTPGKITGVQGWLITYLYENREQPIFQRDIEKRFNIRRSTVTGLIQLMEKNGLLVRTSMPGDARLKRLVLTEQGIAYHEAAEKHIRATQKRLEAAFTPEEHSQLLEMLHRVRDVLSE